jgi:hypothetical protein
MGTRALGSWFLGALGICIGVFVSAYSYRRDELANTSLRGEARIMDESETYRKFAEECRRMARNALPHQKAILLEMAELWTSLAERAEAEDGCASNLH